MKKNNFIRDYKYIFLILASIIFALSEFQKYEYSPDDTFIYLQYSKNIASGDNFSFNKGEPSYGVTSPFWTMLNVIPFLIGINAFWFAKILDLIFILSSFFLFYKLTHYLLENENNLIRIFAVSVFMINPWIIRSSFTGMETTLAIFVILSIFYFYYSGKFYLLFVLIGLSILVRPETFLLFFIFFGIIIFKLYKKGNLKIILLIKYICCTLIITVPFWIFAYFNFGTIVSNTSLGKAAMTSNLEILLIHAKEILRIFTLVAPFETILAITSVIMLIYKKQFYKYLPVILWICSLLILYISTTAAFMSRYFLILYPFVVLLCLELFEKIKIKRIFLIPALLILFASYSQIIFYHYVQPFCEGFTSGVNNCLIPLGKWLNNNTPEGSRILVNDVGAIGFYADRYIIDAAALINRDLELNKKILAVPNFQKEYPHHMLNFIETDYIIEKDTAVIEPLKEAHNYRFERLKFFVFAQLWVHDPAPKYYSLYRVYRK